MPDRNKKGFTLIELLVVIAIIGILAAIVMVSLGQVRKSAREARLKGEAQQMRTASELYFNSHGDYGDKEQKKIP